MSDEKTPNLGQQIAWLARFQSELKYIDELEAAAREQAWLVRFNMIRPWAALIANLQQTPLEPLPARIVAESARELAKLRLRVMTESEGN